MKREKFSSSLTEFRETEKLPTPTIDQTVIYCIYKKAQNLYVMTDRENKLALCSMKQSAQKVLTTLVKFKRHHTTGSAQVTLFETCRLQNKYES